MRDGSPRLSRTSAGALLATDSWPRRHSDSLRSWPGGVSAVRSDVRDEEDARYRPDRVSQPTANGRTARRKRRVEDRRVRAHLSASTIGVGQDQHTTDDPGPPSESFERDLRSDQPDLLVELSERFFALCDVRFDLLDHDRPPIAIRPKQVDRPSLAEFGIADLGQHLPAQPLQPHGRGGHEGGVPSVDQSVESWASPQHLSLESGANRSKYGAKRLERDTRAPSALDRGDERLRDARALRYVDLSKAGPQPERAERST